MKDHRLLEAVAVLIVAVILFGIGFCFMERAWVTAFVFFAISLGLFLMGIAALVSALFIK